MRSMHQQPVFSWPPPPPDSPQLTSPPSAALPHTIPVARAPLQHKVQHDIFTGVLDLQIMQVLFYVIFWLFYQETHINKICRIQLQSNQIFFSPSVSGGNPIQKPTAPNRPHNSHYWWIHSVCWLARALCWLSHSLNCPWAPWNSQPIWLNTCTHISKHCIDWSRGSEQRRVT